MALLDFQFENGALHFPASGLWLDAHRAIGPGETVFVSPAHSDHTAAHARVILSPPTQRLMRARVGGKRVEHVLEFHQRVPAAALGLRADDAHVTLLPAGHILGSAMILLEAEATSPLYTGDFKLRRGISAEAGAPRQADVLVMETTFGRPGYVFPPTHEILAGVVRFCREALDNGEIPVLLGYSLGKSQEILAGLAGAGLPIALSEPVARLTAVYESFGQIFPSHEILDFSTTAGKVILAPPGMSVATLRRKLGPSRVAVVTGWAVDSRCRYQYQADAAFPLSDHADFPELVEFVRRVAPRRVYTLHGFAADFAAHPRTIGFEAQALSQPEQLELGLPIPVTETLPADTLVRATAPGEPEVVTDVSDVGEHSFRCFASTCASIASERTGSGKVRWLAAFLEATDPAVLSVVTRWLFDGGGPGAAGESPPVRPTVLRDAIREVAGVSEEAFRSCYLKHSDTGETAAELLRNRPAQGEGHLSLEQAAALPGALASAHGSLRQRTLLAGAWARCSPDEARMLVRILSGSLRIGLTEGLVEDAIALAFEAPAEAVRAAHRCVGNPSEVAMLTREGRLSEAVLRPFRPVRMMLASPEPASASVWERVLAWSRMDGPASAWVEPRYGGVRCQLHKVGSRVVLYSGGLKEMTDRFPEVSGLAATVDADVILDGELVALRDGRVLSSADLQRQPGWSGPDLFPDAGVSSGFVVSDLLWCDGRSLIGATLLERREELGTLNLAGAMPLAPGALAREVADVDAALEAARARGNEGRMIRDPGSPYLPGSRGFAWLGLTCALVDSGTERPSKSVRFRK